MNKLLAFEGGGDWTDAFVSYLTNISGRPADELYKEYNDSGGYYGNKKFFVEWLKDMGYCRSPLDTEIEVINEGL